MMSEIREERPGDEDSVRSINLAAFNDGPEAAIVDQLRSSCDEYRAFVAVENGDVVGHILFTPVSLDGHDVKGMGLAPMAVLPTHQRNGVGSQLVRHGLQRIRQAGCPFVVVLGHPQYYPRFGFEQAAKHLLQSQWDGVPDEAFMVTVFDGEHLPGTGGVVRYRGEFDDSV